MRNKTNQIVRILWVIVFVLAVCAAVIWIKNLKSENAAGQNNDPEAVAQYSTQDDITENVPVETEDPSIIPGKDVQHIPFEPAETRHINSVEDDLPNDKGYVESEREKQIYSYVQAPPEDYWGAPKWAGDWAHISAGGQEFIYFGCGICCLSNICSTFRVEDITPDIMYYMAKDLVNYYPESGTGAMSWSQLKKMCESFGAEVQIKTKPADYSQFQKDMDGAEAVIVLVSKANDDKLWWYTNGHYVNLWEYDPETDTVFVSDASTLFNRARVSLRDIYNALKTSSDAQYLIANPKLPD